MSTISFSELKMENLVQRCQVKRGEDILEISWDTKEHCAVVSDTDAMVRILRFASPHTTTLLDVLNAVGCTDIDVTWSSIAMNMSDRITSYNQLYDMRIKGEIKPDEILTRWRREYNRTEDVLTMPLEVEILSQITATAAATATATAF